MARSLGDNYLLYVAAGGAPATPDETTNYTVVGQSTGVTLDGTGESVVVRDKDGSETLGASTAYTLSGGVNQSKVSDAGVAIIRAAWAAKTDVGWLITSNVTGEQQFRGVGVPTAFSRDMPAGAASTATFTIGGGADEWTEEAVDA